MKILGYVVVIVAIVFGLFAFGYLAYFAWGILGAVVSGAQELSPEVYVPLAVTVLTASLGLAATLFTQSRSRKREIEAAHRERKVEIYLQFMTVIEKLIVSQKPNFSKEIVSSDDMARELITIRSKDVLWGSPRVLRAISKLTKRQKNTYEIFKTLEEIQRAMRHDLGLSNFGLEQDFFAKLPLSDSNELQTLKEMANKQI